jgi:outer membrane protein OmpA-like peptidoglycan-associated protein
MHSNRSTPRFLAAGAVVALALTGCGPTVFQGSTSLRVVGNAPAPPPPPEPPPEPRRARIVENKIVIDEKIQFAFDKAEILPESHGILNEVVKIMNENPQIKKVRVEGHASLENDTPGARQHNKALSDRRSKAVLEFLVLQGIDRGRLDAIGYGNDRPLADNDSEEGREKNRRVEFNILEIDKAAASPAEGG